MNSAELVNLILEKLRRVKFIEVLDLPPRVKFIWGFNCYTAVCDGFNYIRVLKWDENSPPRTVIDNYQEHVEGRLNGMVRNDAGELVECSK